MPTTSWPAAGRKGGLTGPVVPRLPVRRIFIAAPEGEDTLPPANYAFSSQRHAASRSSAWPRRLLSDRRPPAASRERVGIRLPRGPAPAQKGPEQPHVAAPDQ